ncbi:MAG: EamA family transporter [Chloroflexi bacterium]|nr:EamA family transporter [Chloroflexota bacterium]
MSVTVLLGGAALLIFWGVWGIAAKFAAQQVGMQALIWSQVASLGMFPLYFVFFKDMLPVEWKINGIAWALVSGALGVAGTAVLFLLLRHAPVSLVVPISALYPVVTVALAYVFLHEEMSPMRIAGVVCAVAAVWLLTA